MYCDTHPVYLHSMLSVSERLKEKKNPEANRELSGHLELNCVDFSTQLEYSLAPSRSAASDTLSGIASSCPTAGMFGILPCLTAVLMRFNMRYY